MTRQRGTGRGCGEGVEKTLKVAGNSLLVLGRVAPGTVGMTEW